MPRHISEQYHTGPLTKPALRTHLQTMFALYDAMKEMIPRRGSRSPRGRVITLTMILACCATTLLASTVSDVGVHPLDPLTTDEIAVAVGVLRASGKTGPDSRFPLIALDEPPKPEALGCCTEGRRPPRRAFVIVYERAANATFEAVVDLSAHRLLDWRARRGVQPPILGEEYAMTAEIVRADPAWRSAMLRRGVSDIENVHVDPWPVGGLMSLGGHRLVAAVSYYRGTSGNPYLRPIEGVVAYVDLNARRVLRLLDSGLVPVPRSGQELDEQSLSPLRPASPPLDAPPSSEPGFRLDGNRVDWQNWRFRLGFHPREGLVLHSVTYQDRGRPRPVLYRASVSEVFVTYTRPAADWVFRDAFDEGEYDLGRWANSLEPGTDVPARATFVDVVVANERGEPYQIPRAVALYERDGGLLWKHADYLKSNESRRARQLVVSWIANQGNYEYGFNWIFHQDGAVEMEALLTGIVLPRAITAFPEASRDRHARPMTPEIEAVHHQHWLSFRLDVDVDGPRNTVVEVNPVPAPSARATAGFEAKETVLRRERAAARRIAASRTWKVINPDVRSELGRPVGYELIPGGNAVPLASAASVTRRRAGFAEAHLWVTPYDPAQRYAAGDYPNQNATADGLPQWTKANRQVENVDVVLWYTMGITHLTRTEDWPVMPVHRAGFRLAPSGFFSANPALDVPKSRTP